MKYLYIVVLSIVLFSCEKENNPEKKILIEVDANSSSLNDKDIVYFITSLDGELLASKKIENNTLNVIYNETNIGQEKYNVHRFENISNSEYNLISFFNTDKKLFEEKERCSTPFYDVYKYLGTCIFNFVDIPNYDYYDVCHSSGGSGGNTSIKQEQQCDFYNGYGFLYTFIKENNSFYYKYYDNFVPNTTYDISLNTDLMKSDMQIHTIPIPQNLNVYSVFNQGCFDYVAQCYTTSHYNYTETDYDLGEIKIIVPPNSSVKHYESEFTFSNENKKYVYFNRGAIPTSIPQYNFNIELNSDDIDNIDFKITGDYGLLLGEYNGENFDKNWKFYTDNPAYVNFPVLPDEILALNPYISKDDFSGTQLQHSSFKLINDKDKNSYVDFKSILDHNFNINNANDRQYITIEQWYNK